MTLGIDKRIDSVTKKEYGYIVRDLAVALRDGTAFSEVKGLSYRN